MTWHLVVCICIVNVVWYKVVGLPEWSKGSRSGRDVFVRVGSNPTADIFAQTAPQALDTQTSQTLYLRPGLIWHFESPCAPWNICVVYFIYIYAYFTLFDAWARHFIPDSSGSCSTKYLLSFLIRRNAEKKPHYFALFFTEMPNSTIFQSWSATLHDVKIQTIFKLSF